MNGLRILHLSDTHLRGDDAPNADGVRPDDTLRAALSALENLGSVDLLVLSGDLSDDGTAASYEKLQAVIEGFASRHGTAGAPAPIVLVPGNHDRRPGFRTVLGPGVGPAPVPAVGPCLRPIHGMVTVGDFRIITLDSSVPGRSHGLVDEDQIRWLEGLLASDSGAGSIVVVHHPPVAPVTPLHQGIGLVNTERLVSVLGDSDVRLVLSGHYHHTLIDSIAGRDGAIPVVVAAGIVNHNQVLAPRGHEMATVGAGANLIDLGLDSGVTGGSRPGSARVRVLPLRLDTARPLFLLDPEQVRAVAQRIDATAAERAAAQQ